MIALRKTFAVSSPMCCFKAKIETKNGSNDDNKFVYKPTKWVTNPKVLAEALDHICLFKDTFFWFGQDGSCIRT